MPFLADKMKKLTSILALFVFLVVPVFATTIHVPQDYSTIQGGINAPIDAIFKDYNNVEISINEIVNGRMVVTP